MATLHGLFYSPWTERARWALDHHRIAYRYREHTILLGELQLRRAARGTGRSKATVPLLRDGELVLGDSLQIIQYADRVGAGAPLGSSEPELLELAGRVEGALRSIRIRVTLRTLKDREALREAAATAVPGLLAGLCRPVAALGARHVARKYGFDADADEPPERPVIELLRAVRDRLDGRPLLGETFGAGDILVATLLQGVRPADPGPKLPPATRRVWTSESLAEQFADLLEWRDALYARWRWPT
jgi:glutathione S-transferase